MLIAAERSSHAQAQIENAAYEVATQVRAVEESIETALTEMAELQRRMVHARGVTGAGFVTSHSRV